MSTRRQVTALLGVLALVVAALLVRADRADREPAPAADRDLVALRQSAALQPCPAVGAHELPVRSLPCLGGGPDVSFGTPGSRLARPVLVTIWATWCAPCVREVPLLQAFADRAADRVDVLGVLHQDTARNGLEFARQMRMRYPSVVDDRGDVLRAFGSGPPITVLLTAEGRVAAVKRGEFADLAEITALVQRGLGVTVPA